MRDAVDDETYQAGVKWLQSERFKNSRVLSRGDTLDILAVQLHLRHEAWRASKAPGRPRKIKFAEATAAILRRDSKICQRVWKEYVEEAKVSTATDSGPRGVKFPKVKLSKRLLRALREWMHEREVQRERTVAKDVLQYLVAHKHIPDVQMSEKRAYASALRLVQRLVVKIGYKRGSRKGQKMYHERNEIIVAAPRTSPRSWSWPKTAGSPSLTRATSTTTTSATATRCTTPSMTAPYQKRSTRGDATASSQPSSQRIRTHPRRTSSALSPQHPATAADHLGPLPAPPTPSHAAQLMRETVDIFTGGTSKKKETADYHGMFDHKYYKGWMQKLLA